MGTMSEIIYKIEIKTTDKLCAGTDNDVYLQVTGKENKIDFQKMNNKWKNDFERNSLSTFEIAAPPMGDIESIVLKKAGLDDWLCDYVLITESSTGKNLQFNFAGEKIGKYGTTGKLHF